MYSEIHFFFFATDFSYGRFHTCCNFLYSIFAEYEGPVSYILITSLKKSFYWETDFDMIFFVKKLNLILLQLQLPSGSTKVPSWINFLLCIPLALFIEYIINNELFTHCYNYLTFFSLLLLFAIQL